MSDMIQPTTFEIKEVLCETVAEMGGTVTEMFEDSRLLIVRSLLPVFCEIKAGERLQAGIATRVERRELRVHPYLSFWGRQSGAVLAHAVQSRNLERDDAPQGAYGGPSRDGALPEAIRGCGGQEAFADMIARVRAASERPADLIVEMLPLVSRLPQLHAARLLRKVVEAFAPQVDHSRYGLMNAVSATARDMRDADLRWRLEEMAGEIICPPAAEHATTLERTAQPPNPLRTT